MTTTTTFLEMLHSASTRNNSMLCVGLDPEPTRFPAAMQGNPRKIYDFCAAIVDATADLVCAFKPQIAYFAAHGAEDQLERLMQHLRANAPQVPVILDAKRGDIGSTAELRDVLARIGVTMMSAGSHTEPGGYTGQGQENLHLTVKGRQVALDRPGGSATEQFAISDDRSPAEVARILAHLGLDPVWKDWDTAIAG